MTARRVLRVWACVCKVRFVCNGTLYYCRICGIVSSGVFGVETFSSCDKFYFWCTAALAGGLSYLHVWLFSAR